MIRNSVLVFFFCIASLVGCGPVYHTFYTLTPPKTQEGLQCLNSCLGLKQPCEISCKQLKNSCVEKLEREHDREKRQNPNSLHFLTTGSCDNEENYCKKECLRTYHQCYENCGGKVDAETRCISNCEANGSLNNGRGKK